MMIKVDEIIANQNKIIQKEKEDQKIILGIMKKEMEEEIMKRDQKMERMEKDFTSRFNELQSKFEKVQQDSITYKSLF
jgi:hypothetical protein